jgi:hypothetical protein
MKKEYKEVDGFKRNLTIFLIIAFIVWLTFLGCFIGRLLLSKVYT